MLRHDVAIFLAAGIPGRRSTSPDEVANGCRALAAAVGCGLLGVWVAPAWAFAGATPRPDLREGGDPLADVLARALGAGG